MKELLTITEAATFRGTTRAAVWQLVNRKRLLAMLVDGHYLIRRADLINFRKATRGPKVKVRHAGSAMPY